MVWQNTVTAKKTLMNSEWIKKGNFTLLFWYISERKYEIFYATNKDRIRRVKFFAISISFFFQIVCFKISVSKFQFQNFSFKISFQKFSVSKIFLFQNFFSKILVSKFSFFKISVLKSQFQNLSFKISVWKFVHKRIANDRTYKLHTLVELIAICFYLWKNLAKQNLSNK